MRGSNLVHMMSTVDGEEYTWYNQHKSKDYQDGSLSRAATIVCGLLSRVCLPGRHAHAV